MQKADGMNYAPVFSGQAKKVVEPGAFSFSVIGLDHGHIYGMTNGLLEAGAVLRQVYDRYMMQTGLKWMHFSAGIPKPVPQRAKRRC